MIILAIDPSTTEMGWATNKPTWGDADKLGVLVQSKKDSRPTRFMGMSTDLVNLMDEIRPEVVIYYTPFSRGADATRCGWGMVGIIEALATDAGAAVMDIAEATVRKHHGMSPPKEMAKGDRRNWYKNRALTIAEELGYHTEGSDDIADAALLLSFAASTITKGAPK